jgi:Antitoxin SocA-like, Panacea domain
MEAVCASILRVPQSPEVEMTFSKEKFKELVLYIAHKSVDDASFGATKLNKILFWSDFLAFGSFGKAITGATYQRLPQGPAPRQLLPIQTELIAEDAVTLDRRPRFNYVQKRLLPLREADLALFQPQEISLVDEVIDVLRDKTATDVSAISHALSVGWQIADEFADIPYSSVFLSPDAPSESDFARGRELVVTHGWD